MSSTTPLPPKQFTTVQGHRLAHVEMGRGDPIVPLPSWDDWPEKARAIFQGFRSAKGEDLVLKRNLFIKGVLRSPILRKLSDDEMAACRAPFAKEEDRQPDAPGRGRRRRRAGTALGRRAARCLRGAGAGAGRLRDGQCHDDRRWRVVRAGALGGVGEAGGLIGGAWSSRCGICGLHLGDGGFDGDGVRAMGREGSLDDGRRTSPWP